MRPKSIVRFELVYWLWLAVNVASLLLAWPATAADPQVQNVIARMPWFLYAVGAMLVLLFAGIGYAAAHRASSIGRWIVVIIAAASALLVGRELASGNPPVDLAGWLTVVAAVLAIAAAVLLFRPDAAAWFGSDAEVAPAPVE